jgi:Asp-tRNA(Asn)/Glu-tRNA(Gln) amidotransferase A subunit family amidase
MPDSSSATATEIVASIRDKKMTAVSAVRAALERAEQLKDLNAFIVLNGEGALAAAARVDAGQTTGPLAGLPIIVKDNINTAGMPTSAGTPALQNARPARNAPSLRKLLDAGAIVIGKANMHELAFGITGTNLAPFAGPVRNPYDKSRIPGGSSGGTSAAIAARPDAIDVQRPLLQKMYQAYFRDNNLDGILFPNTIAPAPLIDAEKGSGEMSINGGAPVPVFDTMVRNTDPASNAGIPGLSLFAGMTPGGLPVGLEIDGPLGSDTKLLGLGLSIETVLGSAPPPKI